MFTGSIVALLVRVPRSTEGKRRGKGREEISRPREGKVYDEVSALYSTLTRASRGREWEGSLERSRVIVREIETLKEEGRGVGERGSLGRILVDP